MKLLRLALLTIALLVTLAPTRTRAAFLRADVVEMTWNRDDSNNVIGIHFTVRIFDDGTSETKEFGYLIQGDELANVPTGAAAKRAALIAIMKRETKAVFQAWAAERAARVASTTPRNVTTDLGTASLTNTDENNPVP